MRVLAESHNGTVGGVSGTELLELVRKARTFLAARGLKKGDRCGLLAPNNVQWVALDLAGGKLHRKSCLRKYLPE